MTTEAIGGAIPEMTIQWRLRMARELAGMEQTDLARATGIARSTISNYENGATERMKSLYLRQIALACGVDPEWLQTGQAGPSDGPGLTLLPHLDSNQKPFGYRSTHTLAA